MDIESNKGVYCKAVSDNFNVYKSNLKKTLRIMVEDVWDNKTEEVLKEYRKPVRVLHTDED